MKLIDTSSWIDAMRRDGDPEVKARVVALVRAGTAAWCDMVRLELWSGLRGAAERKQMEELEADVINLATTEAVWAKARLLAQRARAKGITVPATDLLIAACAWEHGVEMEHDDAHLTALAALFDH
jgi:predicted nucleic acid-binding protein